MTRALTKREKVVLVVAMVLALPMVGFLWMCEYAGIIDLKEGGRR